MENKSTIHVLQVICKNNDLLSAAKAVVDVIHEIDNIYPRSCDCAEKDDDHHFHKDLANQQHSADAQANFPTALRYIRGLSRAVNAAMTFTDAAIAFWVSEAEAYAADHETVLPNKMQIAQAYLLIGISAESHFFFYHEDRVNEMMLELPTPILAFTAKVHKFMTFDMSRDIHYLLVSPTQIAMMMTSITSPSSWTPILSSGNGVLGIMLQNSLGKRDGRRWDGRP